MNGIDPRGTISMLNLNYGVCETKSNLLYRGEEYTMTLEHAGTIRPGAPDCDYTLSVSVPQPCVLDDPDSIIGVHGDGSTTTAFHAEGKQAYIRIGGLDLDIDLNYDGTVNNLDTEEITEADPGAFTAVSNRVAIVLRSTDFVAWTGTAELVVPSGVEVYSAPTGGTPLSSFTFSSSSLPQTLYVMSSEPGVYTLRLVPAGLNSGDAVKLTVVKVDIIGASANETWPCTCQASKVIFAANVLPSSLATDLSWTASCNVNGSITVKYLSCMNSAPLGTPAGLLDADFFAVFSPSNVPTGDYSVFASLNMSPWCLDSTNLLVRSVPTNKISSTSDWLSVLPETPYGRVYKHTFESSAYSLNGVIISERVTFTNDPFNYGWSDIPYGDSLWTLDSAGTMDDWDMYQDPYNGGMININRFHPTPPGAGTPVDFVTEQTYGWCCPLCTNYHNCYTHYIHTGFSEITNTEVVPKYFTEISGGFMYEEDYLGNPYLSLSNIVVAPTNIIEANGTNTFQIAWSGSWIKSSGSLAPDLNWNWDYLDGKGCTFDSLTNNPINVTVGTNTGTLTMWINLNPVSASDPTYKYHSVNVELVAP